jgi:hypothetical protein
MAEGLRRSWRTASSSPGGREGVISTRVLVFRDVEAGESSVPGLLERSSGGPYRGGVDRGDVDRDRALGELPLAHAVALRLQAAGADEQTIAAALGIDPAGVPALLAVAEAKLAAELARHPGP